MNQPLTAEALDQLFREARTYSTWLDKPVTDEVLRRLYDLMKWGPTSANCSPARIVFVRTPEAKELLRPLLSPGNVARTSCSRRAHWASIADRCPASTARKSTTSSSARCAARRWRGGPRHLRDPVELPLQPRLRRPRRNLPTRTAPGVRGGFPLALKGGVWLSSDWPWTIRWKTYILTVVSEELDERCGSVSYLYLYLWPPVLLAAPPQRAPFLLNLST